MFRCMEGCGGKFVTMCSSELFPHVLADVPGSATTWVPLASIVAAIVAHMRTGALVFLLDACRSDALVLPRNDIAKWNLPPRCVRIRCHVPRFGRVCHRPHRCLFVGFLPHPYCGLDALIAFAASPGQQAFDSMGGGRNGRFTAALLTHIAECGHFADVAHVLRLVRQSVLHSSGGTQRPWVNGSLSDRPLLLIEGEGAATTVVRPFPDSIPLREVFVGRASTLGHLLDDTTCPGVVEASGAAGTTGDGRVSIISGLGGVGKSALARELCRQARRRVLYPVGIFWVDADSTASLDRCFRDIAVRPPLSMHAFRDVTAKPEEVREAVLAWLAAQQGWLLVLDNADNLGVVRPYVPRGCAAAGGHVVVTSRANREAIAAAGLLPAGSFVEDLTVLPPDDALAMLVSVQRNVVVDHATALTVLGGDGCSEATAARWFAGENGVDGLPLALQQAAAYVREQGLPWEEYVLRFKQQRVRLFGDAPIALSPWGEVEAWLSERGLLQCADPLRTLGVTRLADLGDLEEGDMATLADMPALRRRQLWRAVRDAGGNFAVADPVKLAEVKQFLVRTLSLSSESVDGVVRLCGVRRLNDMRSVDCIRQRIVDCVAIHAADKDVCLGPWQPSLACLLSKTAPVAVCARPGH
jgi:hypothetical protein